MVARSLALRWILSALLVAAAEGCNDHVARVEILRASLTRTPVGRAADEQHVAVDVDVEASEVSGRDVGAYCVTVHWFGARDLTLLPASATYEGVVERAVACAPGGLRDGDVRNLHFVSREGYSKDGAGKLPPAFPVRIQAEVERRIDKRDEENPPLLEPQ